MRRGVLIGTLGLFLVFFLWKAVPFLTKGRPATWATPTSTPLAEDQLVPITIPAGQQVCATGMPWGPQARYVQIQVLPGVHKTAPAVGIEATGPGGYRATGEIAAGLKQNDKAIGRINAAPKEITGEVCFTNRGSAPLDIFGVPRTGRFVAPTVEVKVDGKPLIDRQPSITLLSNPDQALIARMGDVLWHAAAWRPIGTWALWILLALLLVGTPVGVAFALAKAAGADDDAAAPIAQPQDDASARS